MCDERHIRGVVRANDAAPRGSYPRLMSRTGEEHTMKGTIKRTAVTLGVAAALGVFATNATAASGQSGGQADALKAARKAAASLSLSTANGPGGAKYRLGDKGLWMQ
jgi:hypothetical protein